MDPESVRLSEISQKEKVENRVISPIWRKYNRKQ